MDNKKLKARYDAAKNLRSNLNATFQLIEKYVVPFRGDFFSSMMSEGEMEWRRREIYDPTAIFANASLSANVHAGLTNPQIRWFDLRFRQEELNMLSNVRQCLEDCAWRLFYALQESNFNLEASELYTELTSFGTGVIVEEVVESSKQELDSLDFAAIPIKECFFETDSKGQVLYFYRELQWTALQIFEKFADKTPDDIKTKALSEKGMDEKEHLFFCIYPRMDKLKTDVSKKLSPELRPFGFKYIRYKNSESIGDEGGYYEMPAFLPRWRKTVGSIWGYSPAMIVLSTIITLQEINSMTLTAADKAIDPPILTTQRGVFGDVDLSAAGLTVVRSMDAIKAFESSANFDLSNLSMEQLQGMVRQAFFVDQLQLKESPAMTATEVNVRYDLMQRLMGPTLSRLQFDFLNPLIKRTFNILFRYKMLPDMPEEIIARQGELDIEYLGPMARAQKSEQVEAIRGFLGDVAALGQEYPEAKDKIDVDAAVDSIAELRGVPPKLLKSKGKVVSLRNARNKQMAQERQLELAKGGSEVVKNLGSAAGAGELAGAGGGMTDAGVAAAG